MNTVEDEISSEQLIAQLLDDDLLLLESKKEAEKLQLDQMMAISTQGHKSDISNLMTLSEGVDIDADLASELYIADARINNDAAYAQAIQRETFITITTNQQLAQKLAAAERKLNLDAEFARKLQAYQDEGKDIDQFKDSDGFPQMSGSTDIDPNEYRGHPVKNLPHDGGSTGRFDKNEIVSKGKGRQTLPSVTETEGQQILPGIIDSDNMFLTTVGEGSSPPPYVTCGICLEPFLATHSPIAASLSPNSSSRLQFGLRLPCPCEHAYCISCLTIYIHGKLDPEGTSRDKSSAVVFPIRCPECPLGDWVEGIPDDVAQRILGQDGMVQWHHQKLLDSIPRLFCPNPKCSALVEADEDHDDPQATCPFCRLDMCVPCRASWHINLTCEEYQALPLDERSPEDRLLLELAKAERWRRCPSCLVIVELVSGCNHMTCRCGFHFCFKCGSPTTKEGKCKRVPPCELWDEELLLDVRERQRNNNVQHIIDVPPQDERPPPPAPPLNFRQPIDNNLDWMDNPRILCGRHWFTTHMIRNLMCGYCDLRLNSLADLRYHLSHVRRHEVYACCGRFFKRRTDYDRHGATGGGRFGGRHAYEMTNEGLY